MKKLIPIALIAAVFILAAYSQSNSFTAGTYEGVGRGRNGDITVSVTLSATEITDVSIISHQETPKIADPAIAQIPKAIVDAQSTQIDVVSGASLASRGIIEAVNAALSAAGVDPSTLKPR